MAMFRAWRGGERSRHASARRPSRRPGCAPTIDGAPSPVHQTLLPPREEEEHARWPSAFSVVFLHTIVSCAELTTSVGGDAGDRYADGSHRPREVRGREGRRHVHQEGV